ncbi:replication factor C small subunit [Haloarchaeobius sp. HRN-SO-5]|uniref:replication factor C small subunit n=1 Tax=Haloarchaeobius sp. HRN-SO-5 TaxID=3446118 RepID=UPI003EC06FAB
MSEAEESGGEPDGQRTVWIEKYRPDGLDEVVGHEDIIGRIESYVDRNDLPHLMFAGPAGVGKCVTGETPVLTNRGVERIEDVVGDVDGFGEPDDGLEVLTFGDDGTFKYVAPSKVFGKEADELVTVSTRDGNEFSVTPEHRLLTLSTDGLAWREAENLSAGDRVVRPREALSIDGEPTLDWASAVDPDRIYAYIPSDLADEYGLTGAEEYVGVKRQVFRAYANGESRETVVETTGLDPDTVGKYWREAADSLDEEGAKRVSLASLFEHGVTAAEVQQAVDRIEYVNANNYRSEPISVPDEVTPDLAKLVGLAVSEARIDNGRIRFYNTDEDLLDEFERILVKTFDLEPTRGEQGGTPFVRVISETLTHFLRACFDVFDSSGGGDGIGSTIVTAPEDARGAFLRAMFDAEGYVGKNGAIELTQKNADHITLLSYLLAGIGIPSRRKTERKAAPNGSEEKSTYHTLSVSGVPSLRRFEEEVGFSLGYKADRLAEHAAKEGNPNYDTMPVQTAVDTLCDQLDIDKNSAVPESLNPESPGRENYEAAMEQVLSTATTRLEAAQTTTEQIAALRQEVQEITRTPATWIGSREQLEPLETRKAVASETGVRTDRLLEYADGRRAPTARRTEEILVHLGDVEAAPPVERVQTELAGLVDDLGVSFERLAAETGLRGNDVSNLLRNGDHDLSSLPRFETVADAVESVASEMCSLEVVEALGTLDVLVGGNLYYDEVESVEQTDTAERVYDLTVPESHNYVAGQVPTVMHNTATAVSIAKEIYGDDWQENFLELNASDQRGIDVVRDRIKSFARSSFGGYDYRIIFLDEADALTSDAQSALRRTMEQFSNNTRFVLSCNYSSKIIDPIQSRCAVFRFSPLSDEAVATQVRHIAAAEGIDVTDDGVDALVYAADGDMRKAINGLQAAAVMGDTVDEETVYAITSTARPEEVEAMVTDALNGDFIAARAKLDDLLTERGLAGGDIIDQIHRSAWEFDLDERAAVRLLDRLGEADYRITTGANERVQLEALLASLAQG